ncbi:hypothetical protein VE03_01523 [Pseudogymnoascus sp. 23342-1-I1]|nr:hypothetical protein VE03_01523 [Pseudogymnoascus sp. 23342-1-I1]
MSLQTVVPACGSTIMPRKPSPTPLRRLRASKPKVKTGCITCKIRRVKCDESKPHCRRCLSTGRTCDGYSPPRDHSHSIPLPSALTTLPGTPSERHSFHFFHTHTSPQLRGLFASPFWSQHVLQASLREEAIWHAAVALGALHGGFSMSGMGGGVGGAGEEFAVRQYIKAISCITRPGAERRIDVALIACLLFACFESLRGHHAPALLHLDGGVNLLLELQSQSETHPGLTAPTYPATPYTPLPALQALLTRLDTQATQLIPARRTRLCPVSAPPQNYVFTSLEDAQRASDELWNYCLYTLRPSPSASTCPSPQHQSPNQHQHQPQYLSLAHDDLGRRQKSYTTALSTFLAAHPGTTPREQKAGDTLRLHALIATISLIPAFLSASEEVWDQHTNEFASIVFLARSIMEADDKNRDEDKTCETVGGPGAVSLNTGVLGPLYLVALRCRDPVVRREAVELLGGEVRREGLWDSTLLAGVAERVVGIEEDRGGECGGGEGGGRGRERVADVDVVFDPEGCRAGVRFLMEGGGAAVGGFKPLDVV